MNEEEYSQIGKKLAEKAAECDLGRNQLRRLYRLVKTRPSPWLKAYIRRQISRATEGKNPKGFDFFGPTLLEVINRFEADKAALRKILEYANMYYPYIDKFGSPKVQRWREKLEPFLQEYCEDYGYVGMSLTERNKGLFCKVKLSNFQGNPRHLSSDIFHKANSTFQDLPEIKFWIE